MHLLRAILFRHRFLAFGLVLLALCMKVLLPAGFMLAQERGTALTILICGDASGHAMTREITVPRAAQGGDGAAKQAGETCPYSALSMAAVAGADPVLLALALIFLLALGFASATVPLLARIFHLRPPLRGPPALS